MLPFLTAVTVTGADESVDPKALLSLVERYPFVELGILLSRDAQNGRPRFPSRNWLESFVETFGDAQANIAGHLCGSWVQSIFQGVWPWDELPFPFSDLVRRWQLNTHGERHEVNLDALVQAIVDTNLRGQEVIFQWDQVNYEAVFEAAGRSLKVSALFDLSHGAGVLPDRWEIPRHPETGQPLPINCGFAGGLSPENVADQIPGIAQAADGHLTWIDAETRLRSQGDRVFDLDKVEAFLEAAKPFVIIPGV